MLYCRSTQLREKTMSSYEQTLHLFGHWLADELKIYTVDKIKENVIRKYIDDLKKLLSKFEWKLPQMPSSRSSHPEVYKTHLPEQVCFSSSKQKRQDVPGVFLCCFQKPIRVFDSLCAFLFPRNDNEPSVFNLIRTCHKRDQPVSHLGRYTGVIQGL